MAYAGYMGGALPNPLARVQAHEAEIAREQEADAGPDGYEDIAERTYGTCQGYPQIGCANNATNAILGWELCDACARNFAEPEPPTFAEIPLYDLSSLIDSRDDALDALAERDARIVELTAERNNAGAAMVAVVNAAAAYLAVMTWSPSQVKGWKPGDAIPDYRTPEKRLRAVLATHPGPQFLADLAAPAKTIDALRAELATAHELIGALLSDANDDDTRIHAARWLKKAV